VPSHCGRPQLITRRSCGRYEILSYITSSKVSTIDSSYSSLLFITTCTLCCFDCQREGPVKTTCRAVKSTFVVSAFSLHRLLFAASTYRSKMLYSFFPRTGFMLWLGKSLGLSLETEDDHHLRRRSQGSTNQRSLWKILSSAIPSRNGTLV
jgi:hypothetical protein